MRWLAALAVLVACKSARDSDCAEVRRAVATDDPVAALRALSFDDDEVARAVVALLGPRPADWTTYKPYVVMPNTEGSELAGLCKL